MLEMKIGHAHSCTYQGDASWGKLSTKEGLADQFQTYDIDKQAHFILSSPFQIP